jgi:hypothetical protein
MNGHRSPHPLSLDLGGARSGGVDRVLAEDALFVGFVMLGETATVWVRSPRSLAMPPLWAPLIMVIVAAVIGDSVANEIARRSALACSAAALRRHAPPAGRSRPLIRCGLAADLKRAHRVYSAEVRHRAWRKYDR